MNNPGTLYLCATPIGNLRDITLRVLETLQEVDLIACEDTRNSVKLLNHYNIKKPLISYYEHNKASKTTWLIDQLTAGKSVALLSDAGMPGISDPGYELVLACQAAQIPYTVLPGASASLTALVLSGLASDRFAFEGFLPRKKNDRRKLLTDLPHDGRTLIFYETPHRLTDALADLADLWPDRQMAAIREISKKFEEVIRGTTTEVCDHFAHHPAKGEFVLILAGLTPPPEAAKDLSWAIARMATLIQSGLHTKDAAAQAASESTLSKRTIYNSYIAQDQTDTAE